jgi:hypothetical protein
MYRASDEVEMPGSIRGIVTNGKFGNDKILFVNIQKYKNKVGLQKFGSDKWEDVTYSWAWSGGIILENLMPTEYYSGTWKAKAVPIEFNFETEDGKFTFMGKAYLTEYTVEAVPGSMWKFDFFPIAGDGQPHVFRVDGE